MSTVTAAAPPNRQLAGTALVLGSTLAWSFSGLFTRFLTTDVVTAIAWRSLFGGGFLVLPFLLINGRGSLGALKMGWPGIAMIAAQAICQACTVGAFYSTSIANAAVIYATAPFMAAGLAYWLIRERMQPRTMLASGVAFLGVLIIVSSAFGGGNGVGDALALLMTATFAVIIVLARAYPEIRMMPATILSAAIVFMIFAPFGKAAAMPARDWGVLAMFGFINFTVAMYLFLAGSRLIAAAQAALIGTLEIVLSPFWVFLAFGERPTRATVVGGGMILAVVVWHTIREWQVQGETCATAFP